MQSWPSAEYMDILIINPELARVRLLSPTENLDTS
jgi:hypothetical protein